MQLTSIIAKNCRTSSKQGCLIGNRVGSRNAQQFELNVDVLLPEPGVCFQQLRQLR